MRYLKSASSSQHQQQQQPSLSLILFPSLLLLALTGFVCTHKIQAEEECLSSNIWCYDCDSRQDPNCADPFDFSPGATLATAPTNQTRQQQQRTSPTEAPNESSSLSSQNNESQNISSSPVARQLKRLPEAVVCHGCCVKLTSKTLEGVTYVRRTCTTNLQINYFMVGLVCMKESGDRGKMCFCETDYCNAARPTFQTPAASLATLIAIAVAALPLLL